MKYNGESVFHRELEIGDNIAQKCDLIKIMKQYMVYSFTQFLHEFSKLPRNKNTYR